MKYIKRKLTLSLTIDEGILWRYKDCMALLITGSLCGLLACIAALVLQFRLPGWMFLTGINRMDATKRSLVDIHPLRRRLSLLFYVLSAGFLLGSIFLSAKLIKESVLLPFLIVLSLVVFNLFWYYYRKFDRNTYAKEVLRTGRFILLAVDMLFLVACIVFIR